MPVVPGVRVSPRVRIVPGVRLARLVTTVRVHSRGRFVPVVMTVMFGMVLVVWSCRHTSLLGFPAYIQTRTPNASRAPPVLSPAARAMSAVPKYLLCQTTPTYGANSRRTR